MHEKLAYDRQERTDVLYQVLKDISESADTSEFVRKVTQRVGKLLDGQCIAILRKHDGVFDFANFERHNLKIDDQERATVQWVYQNQKVAGLSTKIMSQSKGLYFPLRGSSEEVGVFAFIPDQPNHKFSSDQMALLTSIVGQLGLSIERHFLRRRLIEVQRFKDSEILYQTLLNSISHEMRTPLTTILTSAEALNSHTNMDLRVREISKSLNDAGDRLNHVIENLLDMSRLSGGTMALKLEWHDLSDLLGVVLSRLSKAIAHHSVHVNVGPEVGLLRIDFRLFEHAISNLILNAAQYTPPGTKVQVTVRGDLQQMRIAVEDDGPGVPEEAIPFIFDKFYRVKGSPPGGTGLGLSIVKSIVELHRGHIEYQSKTPHGSVFKISLPYEQPPQGPQEPET